MSFDAVASLLIAMQAAAPGAQTREGIVQVVEHFSACGVPDYDLSSAWIPEKDGYHLGDRRIHRYEVDRARARILASENERIDLLASIGLTPATFPRHLDEILDTSSSLREVIDPIPPPPDLLRLFSFESLKDEVARYARCCPQWTSTTRREVSLTLPGDPLVRVTSRGNVGWMLPWTVEAGGRTWNSSDIEISKAVLPFLEDESPNCWMMDGTAYWNDWFWSDFFFWSRYIEQVDASLSRQLCENFPGYEGIRDRLRLESVESETLWRENGLSLLVRLSSASQAAIDCVRWRTRIIHREPEFTWDDLRGSFDTALPIAAGLPWLQEWRNGGPGRSICLDAAGRQGFSEDRPDLYVLPAWKDAGLRGEPSLELWLQRTDGNIVDLFASSEESRTIVVSATPSAGDPFLEGLLIRFGPYSSKYVVIDETGRWEEREVAPPTASDR